MNENLVNILSKEKLFPIIRSNDAEVVKNTAFALIEGGVKFLEINVESPEIYFAIDEISKHASVCAGGIITSMQAHAAVQAGAEFLSSPIFLMNLVKFSKDRRIPFIAGTSTANEAYSAWKSRVQLIKIYPIEAMGGVSYLKNLLRPMSFLKIMPTGNVKLADVQNYIDAGAVAVGVGRDLTEGSSYSEITKRVRGALEHLKDCHE